MMLSHIYHPHPHTYAHNFTQLSQCSPSQHYTGQNSGGERGGVEEADILESTQGGSHQEHLPPAHACQQTTCAAQAGNSRLTRWRLATVQSAIHSSSPASSSSVIESKSKLSDLLLARRARWPGLRLSCSLQLARCRLGLADAAGLLD
jgi:hypothetical protein